MNTQEVAEHLHMKAKYANYPKLPKFILSPTSEKYNVPDKGHMDSGIRGFKGRVDNWTKDHSNQ